MNPIVQHPRLPFELFDKIMRMRTDLHTPPSKPEKTLFGTPAGGFLSKAEQKKMHQNPSATDFGEEVIHLLNPHVQNAIRKLKKPTQTKYNHKYFKE